MIDDSSLNSLLLGVEKPARYVGGEYGSIRKESSDCKMAIAFPDLYEIGMCNQALSIIYNSVNKAEGVSCERVFAPAPDFEKALAEAKIPLFTLESRIPLYTLDLIGFTFGYELGISSLLSILQSGQIPLRAKERNNKYPIIIMGGPAASNPMPFSPFIDAVWVGEAEQDFPPLLANLRELKMGGASKTELLAYMRTVDAIWMKDKKASRAIDMDFAKRKNAAAVFPVPSMRVIQDHGSVEIMRGCPNGCRFCHAGLWYRPMRQKPIETIKQEVQTFIEQGGYREITLSSLSTGDYQGIDTLISELSQTYSDRNISFQLPSLKVSSFSLPLIDSISKVRKSGLTFAIETPLDAWQLAINKEVCRSDIISILKEAKYKGYKSAKFYFMIGLPLPPIEGKKEEDEIIDFLFSIAREVKIQINVNIGTFIPKPHTSYQWAAQLSEEEASEKLRYIRDAFRRSAFKISTHDSFVSMLEGVISRGDEETAEIIEEAFLAGCRLDAWDEYIHKEAWKKALSNHSKAVSRALGPRETESPLPWDDIDSGISKNYLKREYKRSLNSSLTQACEENCTQNCGVCHDDLAVVKNTIQDKKALDEGITVLAQAVPVSPTALSLPENKPVLRDIHAPTKRLVFSFTKQGNAAFIPHLGVMEVFSRAFIRCNLGVRYTEGFNPLPRMDFAAPLSLGIMAQAEIATIDIEEGVLFSDFKRNMNTCLPAGFSIIEGFAFSIPEGTKKVSAASILWGFTYTQDDISIEVPAKEEKAFRLNSQVNGKLPLGLLRASVLARSETNPSGHQSYFEAYKNLYGSDEPC